MTSGKHQSDAARTANGATNRIEDVAAGIKARVEQTLGELLVTAQGDAGRLHGAMQYGVLAPGKRVRATILVLCAGESHAAAALWPAAALEMVHAASLMLDDLPSMDNATLRRGRKAAHLAFGEDITILAAISLITRAFEVMATDPRNCEAKRARLAAILAKALGPAGLVRGQELDLAHVAPDASVEQIEHMHGMKTGALFAAAAAMGAVVADHGAGVAEAFRLAGCDIGIAYQAYDDLLDVVATAEAAGKDVRRDDAKATVVSLLGAGGAELRARARLEAAHARLRAIGRSGDGLAAYLDVLTRTLEKPVGTAARSTSPVAGRPA